MEDNLTGTRFLAALGLLLTLAGCQINMTSDLYSSDLRAAADGHKGLTTPATLFLPVTSVDKCAEETAKIVAIMQGMVEPFQPKGCERQDMNSYMLADIQLPILDSMDAWEKTDALFGIISQHPKDSSHVAVFVMMHIDTYQTLKERVMNEFYQTLDLKESTINLVLNNDERSEMSAVFDHAFVNGQPVMDMTFSAPTSEQVTITLSDVSVDFLGKNGYVWAFLLLGEEQRKNVSVIITQH